MDEAERVLARLARIDELRASSGPDLLEELRALVPEAEAWARAEGDARAESAATVLANPTLWQQVPELRQPPNVVRRELSEEAEGMG
jgi:hypothetical protein